MYNFLKTFAKCSLVFLLFFSLVSSVEAMKEIDEFDEEFEREIFQALQLLRQNQSLANQVSNVPASQQQDVYNAVAVSTTTPPDTSQQSSPDSAIVIGPRGAAPFTGECNGRSHYGALSHQRGNSFCYGPSPQGYKAVIDPYLCMNMDQFFDTCPPYGNGLNSYGRCGATSGATWGPPGKPSTTAWGTWTSWWKGVSAFCVREGYWSDSNATRLPDVNTSATIRFTIAAESGQRTYDSEQKRNDSAMVMVEGDYDTSGGRGARTLTSPNFNSPFIYLRNQLSPVAIKINSAWNQYRNQMPSFNRSNGWQVDTPTAEPLFYELGVSQVELSRNGQNFDDKNDLVSFLQEGDFFDQLGFSADEKNNSLGYLLPKLPDASFYYLTVMTPEAVAQLSNTEIDPTPDTMVRRYFAVYPTQTPVLTTGDLDYPEMVADSGFTVRDYGEIIVTPDMFVLWQ